MARPSTQCGWIISTSPPTTQTSPASPSRTRRAIGATDVSPDDPDITGKPIKDKKGDRGNSGRDAAKRAARVIAPDEGELGGGAGTDAEAEVEAELLGTVRQSGAIMRQVSARLAPAQGSVTDLMPNPAALTFTQSALTGGILDADSSEIKDLAKALVASETSKAPRLTRQNAPTNLTGANDPEANSYMDDEDEGEDDTAQQHQQERR